MLIWAGQAFILWPVKRIEAVIFDWGGVLIEDPAPGLVRYCAKALGVSREAYEKAYQKFAHEFYKGMIDEDVFWAGMCGQLGAKKPVGDSLWGRAFAQVYSPRQEMFELAMSLQASSCKTAVLSNTEKPATEYFFRQGYDMFDELVFSCLEGTAKPERRIYEITLELLGVKADEAVFIDDNIEYVEASENLGIKGMLYESIEIVKKRLGILRK